MKTLIFSLSLLTARMTQGVELQFPQTAPTEAKASEKSFHVLDGFEMKLIAAEPLVTDPVAITYDEDGRAYVCEMNDYPYTDKEHHKHSQENPTDRPIGKVRLLTDADGDGVFDKATVFAEGLSWPTGAVCWKGGVFVTATPDVWYLKDSNGDGVADVRVKVFTGFKKLNVQAVMNNPIWGSDHRIYVAGGSNGGTIERAPGSEAVMPLPRDSQPLAIKRQDFSFDPSTGEVRLESGGARFGNTFDDWGNRFLCNIRNPCQHVVLPYRHLARNPYLVVPSALNDCAEAGDQLPVYRTSPPEPWRDFRAKRWVQEGSTLPKSELVGAGVVTSSSGITVYRGDAYPKDYRDFAFVADVAGNLFYRMRLVPDGVTFKAVQVDGSKNFCTSDDLWFRPVNFVNAPDGCLHVCDMYREVIEHPWSIPDDIHAALDLLRGRDKGRLFRLAPASFKPRRTPKLSAASTSELVALLDHPNAWHRETAQRLLFERRDKAATDALRSLAQDGRTAQGKIGALWSLESAGFFHTQAGRATLANAIKAGDQHEQTAAVWIAEGADGDAVAATPEFAVQSLMRSARQNSYTDVAAGALALALSTVHGGPEAATVLMTLAASDQQDPWLRQMVLLAAPQTDLQTCIALASNALPANAAQHNPELAGDLAALAVEAGGKDSLSSMCKLAFTADSASHSGAPQFSAKAADKILAGVARGMQHRGHKLQDVVLDDAMKTWWQRRVEEALHPLILAAKQHAPVPALDTQALTMISLVGFEQARPALANLLRPYCTAELQLATLAALNTYRETAVADLLIEAWPSLTPPLRDKAAALMLSRIDRIAILLDAIEAKRVLPAQINAAGRAVLARQKDARLAERVGKVFAATNSNRSEVVTKYQSALSLSGDPARGARIYETACMICHRHGDRGNDIGPHLGTVKGWTPEQILTNVLDPNREVSPNFALYLIETNDGRTLTGLISSETAGNLVLKLADGSQQSLLRSDIKSLTSPGLSLMPEGLEAAITQAQMADLIAFLKGA